MKFQFRLVQARSFLLFASYDNLLFFMFFSIKAMFFSHLCKIQFYSKFMNMNSGDDKNSEDEKHFFVFALTKILSPQFIFSSLRSHRRNVRTLDCFAFAALFATLWDTIKYFEMNLFTNCRSTRKKAHTTCVMFFFNFSVQSVREQERVRTLKPWLRFRSRKSWINLNSSPVRFRAVIFL